VIYRTSSSFFRYDNKFSPVPETLSSLMIAKHQIVVFLQKLKTANDFTNPFSLNAAVV
jgi:hypothetical protein